METLYANTYKLLIDRGYKIKHFIPYKYEQFVHILIGKTLVYIHDDRKNKKFNKEHIQKILGFVLKKKFDINLLIMIVPQVKAFIKRINENDDLKKKFRITYKIETIQNDLLRFVLTEHKLFPKHELLRGKEIKTAFKDFSFKKENLTYILPNDPAVIWFGAKLGDVFKITTIDASYVKNTVIQSVNYRLVVDETLV